MTPVQLLEKAKQSIAADPEFDMSSWSHCLANHVCRVAGDCVVYDRARKAYHLNSEPVHVRATELLDIPYQGSAYAYLFNGSPNNKPAVYTKIDAYIAGVAEVPELVGV